jgi:putative transposon-encoded protein
MPNSIVSAKFDLMRLALPKDSLFTLDNNTIKVKHSDMSLKAEIEVQIRKVTASIGCEITDKSTSAKIKFEIKF